MYSPHLEVETLKAEHLHKSFRIILILLQLFKRIYHLTHKYLFYTLGYVYICAIHFDAQFFSSFGHCGLFNRLLCPSGISSSWCEYVFVHECVRVSTSLLSSITICSSSSGTFPVPNLESAISSRNPISFYWRKHGKSSPGH